MGLDFKKLAWDVGAMVLALLAAKQLKLF